MIESMVAPTTDNILQAIQDEAPDQRATWNAVGLGNTNCASRSKWVHLAKVAYDKYFLHKVRAAEAEPYYEKTVLKMVGAMRLKETAR